jgi:chromosome segregation ATPase
MMPLPTIRGQQAHLGRAVLLLVIATLAVIAPVAAIFFRSDPQVSETLQYIRTDQQEQQQQTTRGQELQQTTSGQEQRASGEEAISDRSAAEKFLAQTRGTKATDNSLAAEDQIKVLSARLSTLQESMKRILRDNAALAEQLMATQTQMAQDKASVAEQLKALMDMMSRRSGILAMGSDSEEQERRQATIGSTVAAPASARSQTAHRRYRASRDWFTHPASFLARGIYFGRANRY